ncbi:MAG: hypothetical protein JSW65_07945, partial [Candidatus Bipolaricaulota bacterium]
VESSEITLGPADGSLDELLGAQSMALSLLGEALETLGSTAGEGLSDALREELEAIAAGLPDSSLRDALEELLEAEDPQAVEEQLSELQEFFDEEAGSAPVADEGIPPDPGTGATSEELWSPPELEPDALQPQGPQAASGEHSQGDGSGQRRTGSDSGPGEGGETPAIERMLGGTEGLEEEADLYLETGEPAFYETEVHGEIGLEGEFEEFVTRGVPLEPAGTGSSGDGLYIVNYDDLRAILDRRGIDPADRELIRRYFEAVTQGGT